MFYFTTSSKFNRITVSETILKHHNGQGELHFLLSQLANIRFYT